MGATTAAAHRQEITVTITGTNDRPELSIANAAGHHEDTASVGAFT